MKIIPRQTAKPLFTLTKLVAQWLGKAGMTEAHEGNFLPMRHNIDKQGKHIVPGVKRQAETLAGFDACWFIPKKIKDTRIIMYCHGGGYCAGSTKSHSMMCSLFAKTIERKLVSFNYRLAPEHAYPAPVDDGLVFYKALLAEGHEAKNIVLMGDSAGGAMVLALAQRLRDEAVAMPSSIIAICPWFDFEMQSASLKNNSDIFLSESLVNAFAKYTFQNNSHKQYSLKHTSFDNLPPVFLLIAGSDLLEDENKELAAILAQTNPANRIEYWQEMPHVWTFLHPFIKEAKAASLHMADFVDCMV